MPATDPLAALLRSAASKAAPRARRWLVALLTQGERAAPKTRTADPAPNGIVRR